MSDDKKTFWDRYFLTPVKNQLTQGVTPKKLAWSCALGITLGIFPILGSTTLLCLVAGIVLKLNQPILQAVNYLIYPAQLVLFPIFVRTGEKLFRTNPITFVPTALAHEFAQSPSAFMSKYGMAGLHGIAVWILIAPFLIAGFYFPFAVSFQKMKQQKI